MQEQTQAEAQTHQHALDVPDGAASSGVGMLPVLTAAPPDQLARSYHRLQLHQTMHVQGLPTTATVQLKGYNSLLPPRATAAEVAELLRVWRDVWHCHPPLLTVTETYKALSEDKDRRLPGFEEQEFGICADTSCGSGPGIGPGSGGLWAQLSWPERRMMVEVTAVASYGAGIADRDGLYMRLLLRARARRAAMERVRQQHAAVAAAAAAGEDPGRTQQAVQLRQEEELGAAALEADREVAVTREANTHWKHSADPKDVNHRTEKAQNAAAGKHFPTRFVTPVFLHAFAKAHQLREVRDDFPPHSSNTPSSSSLANTGESASGAAAPPPLQRPPGSDDDGFMRQYARAVGTLSSPAGATHNLTAAQVWARIVAPALEATGGMSYAEAFLSQAVQYNHFHPDSDTHYAAAMGYGNLSHGSRDRSELPERYGILVPHTPHLGMAELVRSCEVALDTVHRGKIKTCVWLDLFCKGCCGTTQQPPPDQQLLQPQGATAGSSVALRAAAALAEQVGGRAPGPDVLARCTHVALLAHPAWLSPQQTPAQSVALLPPVLTWPATARRLLEAARYNNAAAAVHTPPPPTHLLTAAAAAGNDRAGAAAAAALPDGSDPAAAAVSSAAPTGHSSALSTESPAGSCAAADVQQAADAPAADAAEDVQFGAAATVGLTPVVLTQAFSVYNPAGGGKISATSVLSRYHAYERLLSTADALLAQPQPPPEVAAAAARAAAAAAQQEPAATMPEVGQQDNASFQQRRGSQDQAMLSRPNAGEPEDQALLWRLYHQGLRMLIDTAKQALAERQTTSKGEHKQEEPSTTSVGGTGPDGDTARGPAAAVLRLERVLRLEGHLPPPPPLAPLAPPPAEDSTATGGVAEAGGPAASPPAVLSAAVPPPPPPPVVLLELVVEVQRLVCPADMSQAEADELVGVWVREWACLPDWHTILRTRAACSGGSTGCGGTVSGDSSASAAGRPGRRLRWADMSYPQRRSACELCLLYGPRASNWAPSEEWEAKGRATSSTGAFVTPEFLTAFTDLHRLDKDTSAALDVYPGQAAWNPRGFSYGHTTSWVCANIVLPSTKGYGMCYADLFLSEEAHAACLPAGDSRRFGRDVLSASASAEAGGGEGGGRVGEAAGSAAVSSPGGPGAGAVEAAEAHQPAFASHAWGTPFSEFRQGLQSWPSTDFWIDIFHKNQWQSVAVHDLSDNLRLSGRVALVVFPFPQPLVLTRVWCLFEIMTALQLDVPIKLCRSPAALEGFRSKMLAHAGGWDFSESVITPEILAEVEALDVSTAQATVPADKDMILDMIRNSIGIGDMNKQVKELFLKLLNEVKKELDEAQASAASNICFGGDGLVPVLAPEAGGTAGGLPGSAADVALRRVAEVRPGDWLVTADGGVSRVVLVTVDEVGPAGMEVCALPCSSTGDTTSGTSGTNGGDHLLVTPDHPVFVDGAWRLPRALAPVQLLAAEQVPYGAVFNFELDPPATVAVSGVRLVTLGQDLRLQPYVGVTEESNALYGWGWRAQPERRARLLAQARRLLREERAAVRTVFGGQAGGQARQRFREAGCCCRGANAAAAPRRDRKGRRCLMSGLLLSAALGRAGKQRRRLAEAAALTELAVALVL
ncbi:hypothetical protein HYH02_013419 [Chlamydomonas schloesseri]|uniref:Vint domain-containing protein n=1 Tax=Chlamydomonas schloesseri TaxID=2026947 RepID=A0A835SQD5_9CHLO|nr:hypothetical protein HYH02_013419 [Chlamydomonas schloesseri]|eukprot:KAG2431288.1 hypothetical protein HYH02_013419 [Chlamydomonas schloesseri]